MLDLAARHDFIKGRWWAGPILESWPDAADAIALLATTPRLEGGAPHAAGHGRRTTGSPTRPRVPLWRRWSRTTSPSMRWSCRAICARCSTSPPRHPALRIVIDHGAKPPIPEGASPAGAIPWRHWPHCRMRGASSPASSPRPAGAGQQPCAPTLRRSWNCSGAGRLIFGSDWPVLRLAGDYAEGGSRCAGTSCRAELPRRGVRRQRHVLLSAG